MRIDLERWPFEHYINDNKQILNNLTGEISFADRQISAERPLTL